MKDKQRDTLPCNLFKEYITRPNDVPNEGWKLHVSAYQTTAEEISNIVEPQLRKNSINYKIIASPELLGALIDTQKGKYITVYPDNTKYAVEVSIMLDDILTKNLESTLNKGPVIKNELRLGNSRILYARYGAFRGLVCCYFVDPRTQKFILDKRDIIAPSWIKIPEEWNGNSIFNKKK